MKRLLLLGLLLLPMLAEAGPIVTQPTPKSQAADPSACTTTGAWYQKFYYNTSSNVWKFCSAANTWTAFADASSYALAANVPRLANSTAAQNTIQPTSDVVNLTLKEKASQTADPLQILTSAGAVLFKVDASGNATALSYSATQTNGGFSATEGTGANAGCGASIDCFYPDSTLHRWLMKNNNGTAQKVMGGLDPVSCQGGLGDGLNAIAAGTYIIYGCKNDSGLTMTITGIQCFSDNAGTSTLNAADSDANGLLTGAVTCTASFAAGTQSATTTLATGKWVKFTFVADGTTKTFTWDLITTR